MDWVVQCWQHTLVPRPQVAVGPSQEQPGLGGPHMEAGQQQTPPLEPGRTDASSTHHANKGTRPLQGLHVLHTALKSHQD